jgi:histidyl-tRNA synthetase
MCPTCAGRFTTNPLRILDCKERECIKQSKEAPVMLDHVCDECAGHFALLKKYLDNLQIRYRVNKHIVRGLDYYTKTVFEFVSDDVGTQGTICGGGRYDDLIDRFGGGDIPGTGFALGVERLLMQADAENVGIGEEKSPSIFIASVGNEAKLYASKLCLELRKEGVFAECDTMERSIRAQLKYADKIGASYVLVIGDDELGSGSADLKEMAAGESRKILLSDIHKEIMKMEEQ